MQELSQQALGWPLSDANLVLQNKIVLLCYFLQFLTSLLHPLSPAFQHTKPNGQPPTKPDMCKISTALPSHPSISQSFVANKSDALTNPWAHHSSLRLFIRGITPCTPSPGWPSSRWQNCSLRKFHWGALGKTAFCWNIHSNVDIGGFHQHSRPCISTGVKGNVNWKPTAEMKLCCSVMYLIQSNSRNSCR